MNKFTKVCLIAGGVCILVGGGITTVAAAMGGRVSDVALFRDHWIGREIRDEIFWDITDDITDQVTGNIRSELGTMGASISEELEEGFEAFDDYAHHRYEFTGAVDLNAYPKDHVRKMEVEVRRGRVVILPDSDTDEIIVESETDLKGLSVYTEDEELKVTVGSKTWNSDEDDSKMVVYIHVPGDHRFDEVELKVKASRNYGVNYRKSEGPAIIAENLKAGKLEIDADVGAVSVTDGEAGSLEVDSDVGAIEYVGAVERDVDAECSVGAVKLDLAGEKSDYNYEIKSRVGSVNVSGESFAGLSKERKINNGASKKMELDCSTGAIEVQFH